jgi:hypothetical protein
VQEPAAPGATKGRASKRGSLPLGGAPAGKRARSQSWPLGLMFTLFVLGLQAPFAAEVGDWLGVSRSRGNCRDASADGVDSGRRPVLK